MISFSKSIPQGTLYSIKNTKHLLKINFLETLKSLWSSICYVIYESAIIWYYMNIYEISRLNQNSRFDYEQCYSWSQNNLYSSCTLADTSPFLYLNKLLSNKFLFLWPTLILLCLVCFTLKMLLLSFFIYSLFKSSFKIPS